MSHASHAKRLLAGALAIALAPASLARAVTEERRPVDLVICLDTSGSMTALIDSARAKLWDITNELARATPTPRLRVGLLTYGTPDNSSAASGWIKRHTDLTDDLDTVYAKMMAMTTSGGDEYVGWVLNEALSSMSWSRDPRALKIIFVAGNESADQARNRYDFRYIAERARGGDIVVNAIYAGNREQGVAEHWHEVAIHGGGNFAAIDMQHGTIQIPTPHDDVLSRLNRELNDTYIPYGSRGQSGLANQIAQDANAKAMGAQSCNSRVAAKATGLYMNTFWDLVDAVREKTVDLEKLDAKDLPEPMRTMTRKEQLAYVESKQQQRGEIQRRITEISVKRQAYLDAERKKQGTKTGFDDALIDALRKQAGEKGFEFEMTVKAEMTKQDGC
jgi:hypothetical protein